MVGRPSYDLPGSLGNPVHTVRAWIAGIAFVARLGKGLEGNRMGLLDKLGVGAV